MFIIRTFRGNEMNRIMYLFERSLKYVELGLALAAADDYFAAD